MSRARSLAPQPLNNIRYLWLHDKEMGSESLSQLQGLNAPFHTHWFSCYTLQNLSIFRPRTYEVSLFDVHPHFPWTLELRYVLASPRFLLG